MSMEGHALWLIESGGRRTSVQARDVRSDEQGIRGAEESNDGSRRVRRVGKRFEVRVFRRTESLCTILVANE